MSDKTYVFDSGANNNLASILPALLQNKGIDPSVLAAMGNGGFGGFGNNGLFDILLLFILFGAANNGNGSQNQSQGGNSTTTNGGQGQDQSGNGTTTNGNDSQNQSQGGNNGTTTNGDNEGEVVGGSGGGCNAGLGFGTFVFLFSGIMAFRRKSRS